MPTNLEILGYAATGFSTMAYGPQIVRLIRTRSAKDISILSYCSLIMGGTLWLAYGLVSGSKPIVCANIIALTFMTTVLGLKLWVDFINRPCPTVSSPSPLTHTASAAVENAQGISTRAHSLDSGAISSTFQDAPAPVSVIPVSAIAG